MCIEIYIFCFKQKNTHINKKQTKLIKTEEKEKENVVVVVVNNIYKKSNKIQ